MNQITFYVTNYEPMTISVLYIIVKGQGLLSSIVEALSLIKVLIELNACAL